VKENLATNHLPIAAASIRQEEELILRHFDEHVDVVVRAFELLRPQILDTAALITHALAFGKKLIAFGNGGSATQASHLVGELVGRFSKAPRRPLPAIALGADSGVVTCIGNDFGYDSLFWRQMEALAQPGDIAIGLTTSGASENVLRGLAMAGKKDVVTIALTGEGGLVQDVAKHVLKVPSASTACIQEMHLMILHMWCLVIDSAFTTQNPRGPEK
jgi:D-sedoheptulose 7-phosphate isomerase